LILIDGIIIERSYLIDNIELIRLTRIKMDLLPTLSSCFATAGLDIFLNEHKLLYRFFYSPAMPHRLDNRIHKTIELIGLVAQ
jgi:hypothetical protein